ncbi:MAG: helix-turn-helix domain-containing protein [Candidatus Omnitrophota bacterium]
MENKKMVNAEKLLNLEQVSKKLRISQDEVRELVKRGVLPAYQIGGLYLRFKEEQINRCCQSVSFDSGKYISNTVGNEKNERDNIFIAVADFFYFNDFYIIAASLIIGLVYVIIESIK